MTIKFRTATTDDITNILAIEEVSFSDKIKESRSVFLERLVTFPTGFIVLEEDECGKTVGYICSELWQYQQTANCQQFELGHQITHIHQPQGNELYISSMGVLPEFRGQGFGKLLLQELISRITSHYPRVSSVILIVSEQWSAARVTYQKLGFKQVAVIPKFFKQSSLMADDGIVMRKIIRRC